MTKKTTKAPRGEHLADKIQRLPEPQRRAMTAAITAMVDHPEHADDVLDALGQGDLRTAAGCKLVVEVARGISS